MRRSATALLWIACAGLLGACQCLPVLSGRTTEDEEALVAQVQALHLRIAWIQARLAARRAATVPATTVKTGPETTPQPAVTPPAAPLGETAPTDLATTLHLDRAELPLLRDAGAILQSLDPARAAAVVRANWRTTQGQAHMIKILATLDRPAAETILAQHTPPLVAWDGNDRIRAHVPGHPTAAADGYVPVRLVRD